MARPVYDYRAFVPVVNRPDLLLNVLHTVRPLWDSLTVIDNSPERWVWQKLFVQDSLPLASYTPGVPMSFTQTMNWEIEQTLRRRKPFCVHFHNDAIIPEGACENLLEFARQTNAENPRWGVIFTLYDVLCVYNPKVYREIGGYDTVFSAYFSDNDYFRRMELAGWDRINSGIAVGHVGSQTINSDAYLKHVTSVTFPLHREYYRQKWGGLPGEEKFIHPFGVLPKEWKLANTP